jgi:hypothetical protein
VGQVQGWFLPFIAGTNRRRLEFGGAVDKDGDAIQPEDDGAGGTSAQVKASAAGQSPNSTGATCSTGQRVVLLEHGFMTPQRDLEGSREAASASEKLLCHGMCTTPRVLRVQDVAGTSVSSLAGRILLSPQGTGSSAAGATSRGMLTPVDSDRAAGVDTPEEELRFTHVSCSLFS